MQRFIAGTCQMHLRLTMQGPWMVRDPAAGAGSEGEPRLLLPLRDAAGRALLPASSLKGVLRSTTERILRSMDPERSLDRIPLADDPFVHKQGKSAPAYLAWLADAKRGEISDSELQEWINRSTPHDRYDLTPGHLYPRLTPASQLFGCTLHAGLVTLDDARTPDSTTASRSHVALDRFTGGVGEGPFTEALVAGGHTLETKLVITNFALWHIALLALVIQEINRGYVGIGGGTRKGQGRVQIAVPWIEIVYAEAAYHGSRGVISAQARLAAAPWRVHDVPRAVIAVETPLRLLETEEAQPQRSWREAGTRTLSIHDAKVQQLFGEAVEHCWRTWIGWMATEDEQ